MFFYIPIKFYENNQGLQDDTTRSMDIHSNPVTITFNIDIQIDITVEPPLTDTSIQRIPPNNGQIFSSQNTLCQKVTPPYSGHLSTTDDKIGPIGVRYMEIPLYI